MNPVLASIYGTGFDKTASAFEDELDLNNISAAQLLELIEDEESEKVAFDDGELDLSQMTGAELMELVEQVEAYEGEESEKVAFEQMVEDGSFGYADRMGRIMAHSYADEMGKLAGVDDGFDLEDISGAELLELVEAGYEFGGSEKLAAFQGPLRRTKKGKLTADQKREIRKALKAQQAGPDRGSAAAAKHRSRAGRSMRGLQMEAGMKGRHYGGKALKHLSANKGRYGAGAGVAALLGAGGLAANKMRNRD